MAENYTPIDGYALHEGYSDTAFFHVGADRRAPDIGDRTMCGETNSQYVPFQMPRYSDGVDLAGMQIFIRWYNSKNKDSGGAYSDICNACCNDDFIRFGWLLDGNVTSTPGAVVYTIMAAGVGAQDRSYLFKTAPAKLWIFESIANGDPSDTPDEDWFARTMADVQRLRSAAEDAAAVMKAAQNAADAANDAAAMASETQEAALSAAGLASDAAREATAAAAEANRATQAVVGDRKFFLTLESDGGVRLSYTED